MFRHWLTSLAALPCLAAGLLLAPAAQATESPGTAALTWAEHNATGHPYAWGGTGPYSYDCSGLAMESYLHADRIRLPHNTVAMVDSGELVRTYHPRPGDLAFWGPVGAPFHVELVTASPGVTFGAHDSGTRVGLIRDGGTFEPTAFYRVR
jgi:cell wall-associated NlpC family hydrolase